MTDSGSASPNRMLRSSIIPTRIGEALMLVQMHSIKDLMV